MDEQQSRIHDDLRGLLDGEIRCDDLFLQLYASDASIYQIRPRAVVMPRTTKDVSLCVRYATEHQLSIHGRGAGTGLAGESLGSGIVLDFSRHLRRVLEIGDDTVRVQPGLVLERLNTRLRSRGRYFGPDPAMSHVTTMGSVVAIDAGGSHWLKHGSARRHVRSVEAVLADGQIVRLGRESLAALATSSPSEVPADETKSLLTRRLAELLSKNSALIDERQSHEMPNSSGYNLRGVFDDGVLDFPKLLTGSEGTLALFTEITLDTAPLPTHRAVTLLLFDRMENASKAVQENLPLGPTACDLMDRRHLSLAREAEPRYDLLIPVETEALLLVEQEGNDPSECRERLRQVVDRVRRRKRLAFDSRQAYEPEEIELFWQLARRVVPTLYRTTGASRPLPFVEDMAVPPAVLPSFLVQLHNILKRHQVVASLYGHAGQGQLHVRPFLNLHERDDVRKMEGLASDLYDAAISVGGTISGEHGDGLSRTPFVRRQYGDLYRVFEEVKWIFDPLNVFNPGKIVGDDPGLMTRNLRSGIEVQPPVVTPLVTETRREVDVIPLQLNWSRQELETMVLGCNGCGACRTQMPEQRMCPIFRVAPAEEASPRSKANLLRAILNGELHPDVMAHDDFKQIADLCVNCQMCRLECPASIDIPRLMIEAKAAYVANNGLSFGDWIVSRIDLISAIGCRFHRLANWALADKRARWVVEKILGIAQTRKLPRFMPQTFVRRARRKQLTRSTRGTGPKVLYFIDTYANYHDTALGDALVSVLEHNGVSVFVQPALLASGMALVSVGSLNQARQIARHNIPLLAEAVRQGYQIVTTEPAAALCLTREYPLLVDDEEARLVAENTSEACSYLWRLHRTGKLKLDFRPLNARLGYHTPCHVKALQEGTPGENLLRLIPGLRVQKIEKGCSGMAGTYGLKRKNLRNSLRAGWGLISSLRHESLQAGTTECSACKLQMEQGSQKPTIHPLKILALAYGLLADGNAILSRRPEDLIVT